MNVGKAGEGEVGENLASETTSTNNKDRVVQTRFENLELLRVVGLM